MLTSFMSSNPTESDSSWEVHRGWVNSKISKMKNFGHKVSERNFHSWFVPVMEVIQLQHAPLCLPAPEVKEIAM